MIFLNSNLRKEDHLKDINFSTNINNKPYVSIGILNLMPDLKGTEKDLIKVLDNPIINIKLDFLYLDSKKNDYVIKSYYNFKEIKEKFYDGIIITGAPLEHFKYNNIKYIKELKEFLDYTTTHSKTTLFLCWASEFALNYFYNINSLYSDNKLSGIYENYLINKTNITKGFDDYFNIPISRYKVILEDEILKESDLILVSKSNISGPSIIESKKDNRIFLTGHFEYNLYTLDNEYKRDLKKGIHTCIPYNYYKDNDIKNKPIYKWHAHATLIYHNWLYYYVYNLRKI